jgi:flavin-dependent dehydrogenase
LDDGSGRGRRHRRRRARGFDAGVLARAGARTILADRATFPRDKACGEGLMPAGCAVLGQLGMSLDAFPRLRGVTYRVPATGSACGKFMDGSTGRGVRRVAFDAGLATLAAETANVEARFGSEVEAIENLKARFVVGADGLRSRVAQRMGWSRAPRRPHRYALVGHADAPGHGVDGVVVTVLEGCEVYTAPTGPDELLVALLGPKGRVSRDAYAAAVHAAHPDLSVPQDVRGAGPFWVRPSRVAGDGVFLIGDAAGFLDPLTGDGMSDALVAARELARIIVSDAPEPEKAYRRWEARQWRRRVLVNRLALTLTGSSLLARRALRRLQHRPLTLERLLAVNDGSRSLWSLSLRDWSALAGI